MARKPTLIELLVVAALGTAVLCGAGGVVSHFSRDTYTATVTDKNLKKSGRGKEAADKYMVFTELPDKSVRVFEDTDSVLELKWNSSDLYAKIKTGHTYQFRAYGWRIPVLSSYENIVDVKEVNPPVEKPKVEAQ